MHCPIRRYLQFLLRGAKLDEALLSGANLTGANLRRADLSSANLTGADLSSAILTGADLSIIRRCKHPDRCRSRSFVGSVCLTTLLSTCLRF